MNSMGDRFLTDWRIGSPIMSHFSFAILLAIWIVGIFPKPSGNLLHSELERSTIFNGKIHYKWPFSIAMLNYQRVIICLNDEYSHFFRHHFRHRHRFFCRIVGAPLCVWGEVGFFWHRRRGQGGGNGDVKERHGERIFDPDFPWDINRKNGGLMDSNGIFNGIL